MNSCFFFKKKRERNKINAKKMMKNGFLLIDLIDLESRRLELLRFWNAWFQVETFGLFTNL